MTYRIIKYCENEKCDCEYFLEEFDTSWRYCPWCAEELTTDHEDLDPGGHLADQARASQEYFDSLDRIMGEDNA